MPLPGSQFIGRLLGLPSYRDKTQALVLTAQETLYKSILVLLTVTAILWMSIFLYASFYYTYMPAISHIRPVHLQFSSCGRDKGLCTFPSANVTLTKRQKLLMVGQPYKIAVELEMPESLANQELGMFMVCAELKNAVGGIIEKACRSAILHYKSFFHHVIATFVYSPFLLSGSAEEKQLVAIELFSGFQEDPEHPATEAFIQIQTQHVEIYQTYLKIHAHFTGLRYFMFHWPVLSAMLGISTNFFFLSIIAFLSWYKFYTSRQMVVHVGYDGNAAKSLEERRALAKERLMRERGQLVSQDVIEEDSKEALKIKKEIFEKNNEDEKSKMEEDPEEQILAAKKLKAKELGLLESSEESTSSTSKERKTSGEFEIISEGSGGAPKKEIEADNSEEEDDGNDDDKENDPVDISVQSEDPTASLRLRKTSSPKSD